MNTATVTVSLLVLGMAALSVVMAAEETPIITATSGQLIWRWEQIFSPVFPLMFGQSCHVYMNSSSSEQQLLVYAGSQDVPPEAGPSNIMYRMSFTTKQLTVVEQNTQPGSSIPFKRTGATTILDPTRTAMMLFGGSQAPAEALDDTWEFNITTSLWTEHTEGVGRGPSRRYGTSIVWVPDMVCALMFGGSFWKERIYHNDLWCYSFGTHGWSEIPLASGDVPDARFGHTAAYFDKHMYIYGGGGYGDTDFDEVWEFDVEERIWARVLGSSPPGRAWMQSTIIDGHWVVLGGGRNSTDTTDVWRWPFSPSSALGQWEKVTMLGLELLGSMDQCVFQPLNATYVYMLGGFSYEIKHVLDLFIRFNYGITQKQGGAD